MSNSINDTNGAQASDSALCDAQEITRHVDPEITISSLRRELERRIAAKENEIQVTLHILNSTKRRGEGVGDPKIVDYLNELCRTQGQLMHQLESLPAHEESRQ